MKRLSTWLCLVAFGCLAVFAFPAAGASDTLPGALDASFGDGGSMMTTAGLNDPSISASVLQPDGKIILVGDCRESSNTLSRVLVARLMPNGSFDPSFGTGGLVCTQVGPAGQSFANSVVLQPNGKIVVGGQATDMADNWAFMVSRLNSDGNFDSAFGTAGTIVVPTAGGVSAVALQPDGKIVAGGGDYIARLNADGSFDSSFASSGVQRIGGYATALALQPDGKIVAAGQDDSAAFLVVRLNGGGSPDTTFGTDGSVVNELAPARAVLLQPDGKVVVGGGGVITRLKQNGSFDSSFGSAGTVSPVGPFPSYYIDALGLQPNGKLLAAGTGWNLRVGSVNFGFVARLQANGDPDPSFASGSGGSVLVPANYATVTALNLQPDGKLVSAGWAAVRNDPALAAIFAARFILDLPPTAAFINSPSPSVAGQPLSFDGSGSSDTDGSITAYRWSFGDGAIATGSNLTHVYAKAGTYTVTLTVTDDYGLTNSAATAVTVRPAAPVLSGLQLRPHSFRAARRGGSIARHGGTTVSYRVSLAGKTRFTIHRVLAGRVKGAVRGSFVHQDRKGANSFHFTGRLSNQRLRPGSYRLDATSTATGRTGATIHIRFRITR